MQESSQLNAGACDRGLRESPRGGTHVIDTQFPQEGDVRCPCGRPVSWERNVKGGGSRNRVEPALRGNAGEECGVGLGEIIWSD